MRVNVKKVHPDAVVPSYGSAAAAGADLYARLDTETVAIAPGETVRIPTGIALEIPEGFAGFLYARSGVATKRGLAPANKVGVIDSDYRGEILVALHNHSQKTQTVENGERIAQLVIAPYLAADFHEVSVIEDTERGEGGFGSTGKK